MNFLNFVKDFYFQIGTSNPIYINAYVGGRGFERDGKNWGDDINYWFLREIIKEPFRLFNESPIAFRKNATNYLVIGSTISLLTKPSSIVWGAGCISDKIQLPAVPKRIHAVRGPLTRNHLLHLGIDCPEIYGDPALLLPLHYRPKTDKKYKIGLIQHVSESQISIEGCHSISLSNYDKWTDVIDEICSCEAIASSSLHGLIVAEAYDIPNVWLSSPSLYGGTFKFHDFFQALGADRKQPFQLMDKMNCETLLSECSLPTAKNFDLHPLIDNCPFNLDLSYPIART